MRNKLLVLGKENILLSLRRLLRRACIPYKYTFISTWRCNSRCRICGVWKIYRDNPDLLQRELSTDEVLRIVTGIGGRLLWLNVTGGEPLLREEIDTIICKAYKRCRNFSLLNIPTNGIATARTVSVFDEITSRCAELFTYASLSVDGLGARQDELRGVEGCFDRVMETYARLLGLGRRNMKVFFQITISRDNLADIPDLVRFVKKEGIPYFINIAHEMRIFHNQESGIDVRGYAAETTELLRQLENEFRFWPYDELLPRVFLRLARLFVTGGASPISCSALEATATIDPYGEVFPCPFLDTPIGSLRECNYDILSLLGRHSVREAARRMKRCRRCWQSCEAYPAIVQNIPQAIRAFFKAGHP
ncbi:MAG: hypothetical protein JW844_00270 [Candidatus Omnitrophica bacterium]|nr:hypothetical protein [Candidatus Omnitrophota bacterium]